MAVLTGQFKVEVLLAGNVSATSYVLGVYPSSTTANNAADADMAKRIAAGDSTARYLVTSLSAVVDVNNRV